jgi:uncharacterized protein
MHIEEDVAMQFDGFAWDGGNLEKCQKHGVTIAEIESLFAGTILVSRDAQHSEIEQRYRAVGRTEKGRSLFVVFTWRSSDKGRMIRPLSARYMHKKEVRAHEKEIP